MVIRILVAAAVWTIAVPAPARAQAVGAQTAVAQGPKADTAKKEKKSTKNKADKKPKKPKSDVAAPDETTDSQVDTGGKGIRLTWKQHPSFRAGSWFRLDYEMKFQEDGRQTYDGVRLCTANTPTNCFDPWELHRNRLGISGYVTKKIEYEVEYELTERELTEKDIKAGVTPKSHWKDTDVNLVFFNNAQVRIGKFKIPFSLDQLTGETHNDFIYRSLGANYLAPARDIGAMVHGRFFKRGLNYWVGGFQHDGDNAQSKKIQGGDQTFAGRVTGTPFRSAGKAFGGLQIGTAYTLSKLRDDSFRPNGLRGRSLVSQDTFYEPVYVRGTRTRWEADGDWVLGPVSARGEYTLVLDTRNKQGLRDDDLQDARARSWFVTGAWMLTGEPKKRPVKPANDFLQGGVGAIEVAARIERMWFDSLGSGEAYRSPRADFVLTEGERALTLGVNWSLNRYAKIQVNAIREEVEQRDANFALPSTFPKGPFWNKLVRLQLVF